MLLRLINKFKMSISIVIKRGCCLIVMKNKNKNLDKIIKVIVTILRKYRIKRAGIFGSYVRGEQKKGSDIDILVEFKGGLLALIQLERELEKSLGKKVDILTYNGIHPILKKRILKEEVRVV